jgi:hypothetical protein
VTLEHVIDIRHAHHPRSMSLIGPALPDRRPGYRGGREGGLPPPANDLSQKLAGSRRLGC